MMMLDLQRVEDEKLLQLPRLNPVAMILDVLSDRELPQATAAAHASPQPRDVCDRCCARATGARWSWATTAGSARA